MAFKTSATLKLQQLFMDRYIIYEYNDVSNSKTAYIGSVN